MKSICIDQIKRPVIASVYKNDKLYKVYLGNNYVFESKSFALAKAFLNKTNKFLNIQLHEINMIVKELQLEYRNIWFYLDDTIDVEVKIVESFKTVDYKLNIAISRAGYTDGNYYVFNHLEFALYELNSIADTIAKIQYKKSNMPDYYRLIIIVNKTKQLIEQLEKYPNF